MRLIWRLWVISSYLDSFFWPHKSLYIVNLFNCWIAEMTSKNIQEPYNQRYVGYK